MLKERTGSEVQYRIIGASNHVVDDREENDFYATDPKAVKLLLKEEKFSPRVWEPACGMGHMSKPLEEAGHEVRSTDLVYRGYGEEQPLDFLKYEGEPFDGDIITNPPYSKADSFVEKAIKTVSDGHKVACFLRVLFLEGKKRKMLFEKYPPRTVYICSSRIKCAKNADFDKYGSSAVAFAWFIWEKGYQGETLVKWIN